LINWFVVALALASDSGLSLPVALKYFFQSFNFCFGTMLANDH
jgi:hypothetical protein